MMIESYKDIFILIFFFNSLNVKSCNVLLAIVPHVLFSLLSKLNKEKAKSWMH